MTILIKKAHVIDSVSRKDEILDIFISEGIISEVGRNIDRQADRIIDCKGEFAVIPGMMDMHVHLRDPGFTYKEDIKTGTDAAKAGGFTAVACMPNTKPAADSPEIIKYIVDKAKKTGIDVYPVACITKGMKGNELCNYDELIKAGVKAVSDDGRPVENAEIMRQALELSAQNGLTVISHCEDLNIINGGIMNKGEVAEKIGAKGMDRASEDYVTAREIALAASCGAHIHIAHVSTEGSVNIIRAAKKDGVNVTCETCPHYFTYTDQKLFTKDADYRMNPPLRTEKDRAAVMEAVLDGTIDCIVTDHAPHTKEEKADFFKAPNGVVGLETSLAVTLTQLYHTNKCTLMDIVRLMSENPRRIMGLEPVSIQAGSIADITVFDPNLKWEVIPEELHSKSKNTVFKGEKLTGRTLYTISKGIVVYEL